MTVKDIVATLRTAQRVGADTDDPEGARRVHLSDTLALEMAQALEGGSCRCETNTLITNKGLCSQCLKPPELFFVPASDPVVSAEPT